MHKKEFLPQQTSVLETKEQLLSWVEQSRQNGLITLFEDATPVENHPFKANRNVVQALNHFLDHQLDTADPTLIVACMGSGKSTLKALLYQELNKLRITTDIYTHSETHNSEVSNYWIQAGTKGMDTGIKAKRFSHIKDLTNQLKNSNADIILVDEIIFSNIKPKSGEKPPDPPTVDPEDLNDLLQKAQQHNKKMVFSGLLSDYRGIIWPNIKLLLPHVKNIYEIVGRCDTQGCKGPAVLTTRRAVIAKGISRPSHTNEQVLRPGSVINGINNGFHDKYSRSCLLCHKTFTPKEAKEFDSMHGINTGDYEKYE